jgi:Zn-dependent peptidase ImmA (M78 family)
LESLSPNVENVGYGIDLLSKKQIKEIAEQELNKISEDILKFGCGLDLNTIANYLNKNYNVKIDRISNRSDILGSCDIENKIISINQSLIGTQRYLFVLCHEIGHYILHQNLEINQYTYDLFSDSEYDFMTGKNNLNNPRHWIEWQANYFAASFLLAETSIIARLYYYQNRKNISKVPIYFNDQYGDRKMVFELINSLAYFFRVTKTSIIYRLTELGHFKDVSRTKSVGQLIYEYRKEYYF